MYKVGVMLMGNTRQSPKKVKEIILEVEGKTKITNIAEYLLQMGKISNLAVEISLEKNGQPVSDTSNITQALKYTSPINGVIKLYLYEKNLEREINLQTSQNAIVNPTSNDPSKDIFPQKNQENKTMSTPVANTAKEEPQKGCQNQAYQTPSEVLDLNESRRAFNEEIPLTSVLIQKPREVQKKDNTIKKLQYQKVQQLNQADKNIKQEAKKEKLSERKTENLAKQLKSNKKDNQEQSKNKCCCF